MVFCVMILFVFTKTAPGIPSERNDEEHEAEDERTAHAHCKEWGEEIQCHVEIPPSF